MRILISNDDGVTAPGLAALYAALAYYAECVVVAPDQDKSGASSSLTLDRPLDRKSTRLNSSHLVISYAVFCLKKKK